MAIVIRIKRNLSFDFETRLSDRGDIIQYSMWDPSYMISR